MLKAIWAMLWYYHVPLYALAFLVTVIMVTWFAILATN